MIDLEKERQKFENVFGFDRDKFSFCSDSDEYVAKNDGGAILVCSMNLAYRSWVMCCIKRQHEIDALKAKIAELEKPKVCAWEIVKEEDFVWARSICGNSHPNTNLSEYCDVCGGKVKVQDGK